MDFDDIQKKKLSDLRYIAKMLGIKAVTAHNKEELIQLIMDAAGKTGQPFAQTPEIIQSNPNSVTEKTQTETAENSAETPAPSEKKTRRERQNTENHQNKRRIRNATQNKTETHTAEAADQIAQNSESSGSTAERSQKQHGRTRKTNISHYNHKSHKAETAAADLSAVKAQGAAAASKPGCETGAAAAALPSEERAGEEPAAAMEICEPESPELPADSPMQEVKAERGKTKYYENGDEVEGLLEVLPDNYGFIRVGRYFSSNKDVYVPPVLIRRFNLKTGDYIKGRSRSQRDNEKYQALFYVASVNEDSPESAQRRKPFESLVPIYPDEKIRLETDPKELSTRIIDIIAPIGKGQRGMIVSPPKAGKTVLLKKIANSISQNYPDIKLIVLLIDERPEEVTDMRESVKGEVISSTFDELPEKHIRVAEMVFERAQRLVEHGNDVVILMDSLTRLARAYNITIPPTGRSLSGGLDPGALYKPKRFFGAARNIRGGGSLTIVATALIDTGSRMDDVIFEEFKGTGNMELHLDRKLSEKRVFPAIDINKSGTRKEELLLSEKELNSVFAIRRAMSNLGTADVTEIIVNKLIKTKTNEEFIGTINLPQDLKGLSG